MDQSAINLIQNTALAASASLDTDHPVALPAGFKIYSLEEFRRGRDRFHGEMRTTSINDFCRMTTEQKSALCFINAKKMTATSFFNLGTVDKPGHGDHRATITLEKTAPFREMLGIDGERHTQRGLAEWIEDWHSNLTAISENGDAMELKTAIEAVRRITINASKKSGHLQENFGAKKSSMEELQDKSKHGIPAGFKFTCATYSGLDDREFFLRMSVLTGSYETSLTLRITQLEIHNEEIADEFKEILISNLNNKTKTYIGKFSQ